MIERYHKGEVDAVYIVRQRIQERDGAELVLRRILPVELPSESSETIDYIYEQPPRECWQPAAPLRRSALYRALLESIAAYHAARMTAMDAASSNAGDMIDK